MFKYVFWKLNRLAEKLTALDKLAIALFLIFISFFSLNYFNNQKIFLLNEIFLKYQASIENLGSPSGKDKTDLFTKLISYKDKDKALENLMSYAALNDIQMTQANYQAESLASGPFIIFHINLNFNTTFDRMKSFIYAALINQPYLSIDELRISRNNIESDLLDTHLVLTMYLKNEN